MKYLIAFFGFCGGINFAYATAMPPVGHFVCPLKNGEMSFSISNPMTDIYFLKVLHKLNGDVTNLQGTGMIASFDRSSSKGSFQVIRLPSTTFEAYFDDQGNIGLVEDALNCQKM